MCGSYFSVFSIEPVHDHILVQINQLHHSNKKNLLFTKHILFDCLAALDEFAQQQRWCWLVDIDVVSSIQEKEQKWTLEKMCRKSIDFSWLDFSGSVRYCAPLSLTWFSWWLRWVIIEWKSDDEYRRVTIDCNNIIFLFYLICLMNGNNSKLNV